MGREINKIVETKGYQLPCRIPGNQELFFRGRGATFKAAQLLCATCPGRPECLADGINEGIARIEFGDPITNHARNTKFTTHYDFPPVTAGFSNKQMRDIANEYIDSGILKVDVNMMTSHLPSQA